MNCPLLQTIPKPKPRMCQSATFYSENPIQTKHLVNVSGGIPLQQENFENNHSFHIPGVTCTCKPLNDMNRNNM